MAEQDRIQNLTVPGLKKAAGIRLYVMLILTIILAALPAAAWAGHTNNVRDYLDFLRPDELNQIQSEIERVAAESNLDIVIVITDDTEGKSSEEYADDYYDQNGFGVGSDYSGILMLINMDIREVWLSTCGRAIRIFTDNRIDNVLDAVYTYLSDGDYFSACKEFTDQVEIYARMGVPQGQYNDPSGENPVIPQEENPAGSSRSYWNRAVQLMASPGIYIFAVIIAVAATLIASSGNKGKVTVSNRTYEEGGSFNLIDQKDIFINQTVTRVKVADSNTGSKSGRSSVHTSSSGRSHGGGGRRF